jgi:hypothetical protein
MKPMIRCSVSLVGLVLCAGAVFAQFQQTPGAGGWNAAMTRAFGDVKAFSAKAEMRVLGEADKEMVSMNMDFALLDGNVRMEMDLAQMKSAMMPPGAAASLKQMGMDRITTLILPDKKAMYLVYPGLQAYVDMPMPEEEASKKDFTVAKAEIGKETIDGHACAKNKLTMTDEKGAKREILVWEAADLKSFPIQLRMGEGGTNVVIRYKDVQFAKPEAKQFEAPAGYTKHTDMMQLMQGAMQRMTGGAGASPGTK